MDTQDIRTIYYFPTDAKGNEVGEPIEVKLQQDGSADISALPEQLRKTLEAFGTPDELHFGQVFPKDGARFLKLLLNNANGYRRFRLERGAKNAA
ncbi:hypothetical protein HZC53_00710 [Candidatus Uhrbacteria bacterium]|nr:hypothetical protein [Candidatus Uhrbacteria bacterium]